MSGRADIRFLSHASLLVAGVSGRNRTQRGFTLVELMIGLVLVAILLGIGMPQFRNFILEQRLRATSSDLRVALMLARSEAIKRNRETNLRPNAAGWSDGWTIPSPIADDPDILNHKQTGDATITGPAQVTFSPAGRTPSLEQFSIKVGDEPKGSTGCLRSQLDGRSDYCPGACPLKTEAIRCASGPMKSECRCPVSRQRDDGTCLPCPT